jgi:hypothetical protein
MGTLCGNKGFFHFGCLFIVAIIAGLVWLGARIWQTSPLVQQIGTLIEEGRETVAESDGDSKSGNARVLPKSATTRPEEYYLDAVPATKGRNGGRK